MKKLFVLALTAVMTVAGTLTVSAQEKVVTLDQLRNANRQTQRTTTTTSQTVSNSSSSVYGSVEGWKSVYAQYNFAQMHTDANGHTDNEGFSAVTLGANMAFGLFGDLPLYLQPGVALNYGWDSDKKTDRDFSMFDVKVPVNLVYSFQIPNTSISVDPYLGIYGRAIILGQYKHGGETYSWFDEDDMNYFLGDTANRFQLGAQAGANVKIGQFFVGAEYAMDATEVYKHNKTKGTINAFSINAGICF